MKTQSINDQINWIKRQIRVNRLEIKALKGDMKFFLVLLFTSLAMAVASIPVCYGTFGEDGLLLGAVILTVSTACAFAVYMQMENTKLLIEDARAKKAKNIAELKFYNGLKK